MMILGDGDLPRGLDPIRGMLQGLLPMPTGLSSALPSTDVYATLSAMITPAIFLTANGSLIISTSNRMSRVVDRIRVLNDLGDRLGRGVTDLDYTSERLTHVQDQLRRLLWRGGRPRSPLSHPPPALA